MTTPSGPQPADFADVRATNLAVVLRDVRAHAPCSRADIAARTGLNKATVSSLVAELIDRRLIRETGITEHRIGRPATMLVVDGGHLAAIGLEIGFDQLTVVALDLAGVELVSWRRSWSPSRTVTGVAALVGKAVARVAALEREVLALTVGVPGPVDDATNVPVLAELRRALRDAPYEVAVDSSANLAVTAEHRAGEHAGTANLAYVTGDWGITAGLVVDGHLLHGARGFTGRLGRLMDLDARAGLPAIVRRVLPDAEDDGPIVDYAPEIERMLIAAKNGEPAALDGLAEAGHHLGRGLSALADLVDPEVILLGGGYARLAEWLLPPAAAELDGSARLNISSLGATAAALGGAMRALADVESGNLPAPLATAAR